MNGELCGTRRGLPRRGLLCFLGRGSGRAGINRPMNSQHPPPLCSSVRLFMGVVVAGTSLQLGISLNPSFAAYNLLVRRIDNGARTVILARKFQLDFVLVTVTAPHHTYSQYTSPKVKTDPPSH